MRSESPVWCAKCYLRIAPYAPQTVYRRSKYHQNCFLKVVREDGEQAKVSRMVIKPVRRRRRRSA